MPLIKRFCSQSKFDTKTCFFLLAAISSAVAVLLGYYLRPTEGRSSSPALGWSSSPPSNAREMTFEIPILPASAFKVPPWKRPLGKDYWPGIQQPPTVAADGTDLEDDALVIGVCVNGQARAYRIDALSGGPGSHVINDVLAGRPVTVVYCDLMRCARVFTATTGSAPLTVGDAGWDPDKGMMLYLNGVHYALEDGTNLTRPQGSPLPYQRMERVRTTWGRWRRAHPDTDVYVLSPV